MTTAEDFANMISMSWRRAQTSRCWFQIRSWCHGAALMADLAEVEDDIRLLQKIATQYEYELES